jgi:hypothetical protein
MPKKEVPPLVAILSFSALLGTCMLTYGHVWWDDFAAYIMQAQSILNGDMPGFVAHNTITIKSSSSQLGPITYPWGYPLLLAPVYRIFGLSPMGFKLVGVVFHLAFLAVFYILMRRRFTPAASLLALSLFAFNPMLLGFLDYILTDIPFLFVATLTVLLIDKYATEPDQKLIAPILIGAAIFAGFFLRTPGIVLLGTFLAYQAWRVLLDRSILRRIARDSLVAVAAFGLLWLTTGAIFPGGQDSYFSHFEEYGFGLESVLRNAGGYFLVMSGFFDGLPLQEVVFWIFTGFFILGVLSRLKRDLLFVLAILPIFLANVAWPEWQGIRFMFPVLPFFVYFALQGMKAVAARVGDKKEAFVYTALTFLVVGLFAVSSLGGLENLRNDRRINGPFDPYSMELYDFIKGETPSESVIVFFRPRVMRLMTGRDSISITDCGQLTRGDYIALSKKVGRNLQIPPEEIEDCELPLEELYENRRFVLLRINK